jgi:hypothetical protein
MTVNFTCYGRASPLNLKNPLHILQSKAKVIPLEVIAITKHNTLQNQFRSTPNQATPELPLMSDELAKKSRKTEKFDTTLFVRPVNQSLVSCQNS